TPHRRPQPTTPTPRAAPQHKPATRQHIRPATPALRSLLYPYDEEDALHGTLETHHPADLALYSRNPRVGDVDAIAASLRANGQYKPVVVNRGTHTSRPMEVLAGNHTVKAFRTLAEEYPSDERWQSVDAWVIDVDDDRAARIVAADNRTSELGGFDDDTLLSLLSDLSDLEGTGYGQDDLDDLSAALEELDNEEALDHEEALEGEGDPLPEGLAPSHDHESNAAEYDERATRMIVLLLPINQYVWAHDKLATFIEENPE